MNAQYCKIAAPGKFAVSAMASPRSHPATPCVEYRADVRAPAKEIIKKISRKLSSKIAKSRAEWPSCFTNSRGAIVVGRFDSCGIGKTDAESGTAPEINR